MLGPINTYDLNLLFHAINDDFQAISNFQILQIHLLLIKFHHTMACNCPLRFLLILIIRWGGSIINKVRRILMMTFQNELETFFNKVDWCY